MRKYSNPDIPERCLGNRIRILAEVVDEPGEIALVKALLQRNGCLLRSAEGESATSIGLDRTSLIFDVWLPGSRRFATRAATKKIEDLAEQAKLGLWIRDAALVGYPRVDRKTYYVYNRVPHQQGWSTALKTLQAWSAKIGTSRLIQVPAATPESAVQSEISRRDLGWAFDREQHSLRALDEPSSGAPEPSPGQKLLIAGSVLAAVLGGAAIFWVAGLWRMLPLLLIIATSVPLSLGLRSTRLTHRRLLAWTLLLSAAFATIGALTAHIGGGVDPRAWLGRLILASIGILISWGVVLAARVSWLGRNVAWIVPLTFTLLASTVPWVGSAIFAEYITQFGIPDTSVSVPAIWKILVGGQPLLIAIGTSLFFISLVGWLRYFHLLERDLRWIVAVSVVGSVLVYALAALEWGYTNADAAARQAKVAAQGGHEPASYFGLQGTLVCVQPLTPQVPVLFGPLTNRPLLSFGANGDRLWVWDPDARHNENTHFISVALQDVTLIQATGDPAHCPPRNR